eukprot:SAG11_NODE_1559_length_4675_cov_4.453493_2_plen_154_part_00
MRLGPTALYWLTALAALALLFAFLHLAGGDAFTTSLGQNKKPWWCNHSNDLHVIGGTTDEGVRHAGEVPVVEPGARAVSEASLSITALDIGDRTDEDSGVNRSAAIHYLLKDEKLCAECGMAAWRGYWLHFACAAIALQMLVAPHFCSNCVYL